MIIFQFTDIASPNKVAEFALIIFTISLSPGFALFSGIITVLFPSVKGQENIR